MANLSILSGIEFYSYDVEVYDKVLLGIIRYKDSQVAKFKNIDSTFFENKSFYGINRGELVREFVKYLSKFDPKIDKDVFLLGDVVDKRIKKGTSYVNDTMIFMASTKQYDAQASNKNSTPKVEAPKEILKLPMIYKDKIYKVRLNLDELGIGSGLKVLYDFNEKMLKSRVESFLKSYKKDYDVQLSLEEEFVQVGKLLIDVTVYNDHVEGFIDLSSLNLDGVPSIRAEGKDKQDLLNNIIQQLKSHKLTGKLNWGTVTDKTIKKGAEKVAKTVEMKDLKALVKNISTMVKKVGMNEDEIEGRIISIIPNASALGVGNLGGEEINIAYVLPWKFDKEKVKKKKFAEEVAETHPSNVVIKEVDLTLYVMDDSGPDKIRVSIDADVKWINTFFGTQEQDSYTLIENYVDVEVEQGVTGNLLLQEFIEKIASRSNVKLVVKIDKDTPFPVSFDVEEKGFAEITVRFDNNASQFRAYFRLDAPFVELQSKTFAFFHYLKEKGFGVTQEGLGVVVKGSYNQGDVSIVHDIATLLDTIKGFSYKHSDSFEAWAKKHKYGYTEAKAFYQVRDIMPNYEGDAIVYKSGKSNYIAIPNDVEGIDGFIDAVKHAYTPEKSGAFIRFYFPNLEEMQKFVEFANKIDKPVKEEPSFANSYVKKGEAKAPKLKDISVFQAYKDKIMTMTGFSPIVMIDKDIALPVSFQLQLKGFQQFDVSFYENSTQFRVIIMPEGKIWELEPVVKKLMNSFNILGFDAQPYGMAVSITESFDEGDVKIISRLVNIIEIAKTFAKNKNDEAPQSEKQDLGGVKPNNKSMKVDEPKITDEPIKTPKDEVEPPNREVERTYKAGKVKDSEHKAQLDRMRAYIKKIADVVDADNDFALRFLEEPKEFQKYKLPTVGVGLFYYGDKSITELEQNALYKKVYRGRGLSVLRKFFKTTDLNGEKCLLVLFVDAQYAKETKAKLIKESFELGNKVRINGRLYKVNAIYEHKFAIETIAGLMYIDMDSDLIDITIEED